jgi:methionyl-tRNA formyltransferase
LPDFPGRNASSWAIYEGREKTGITWHYVTAGIDEGDIIIQKECAITSDMKAYELVAVQMKLAAEAFEEIYESVLNDDVQVTTQCFSDDRKLYKSKDIPGGGTFDLEDNPQNIYKLLRAIDYGKNAVFPTATTLYNGEKVRVLRYKKIDEADIEPSEHKIYLPFEGSRVLMIKYDKYHD